LYAENTRRISALKLLEINYTNLHYVAYFGIYWNLLLDCEAKKKSDDLVECQSVL